MRKQKQVRVGEYAMKKVITPEQRARFIELMREWDGSGDVVNAWYDWDLLVMKHNEVLEEIND